jgi:Domain of Unknown Function with PDB structure (DUF3857)
MTRPSPLVILCLVLFTFPFLLGQSPTNKPAQPSSPKIQTDTAKVTSTADYSQEAYVVERQSTTVSFDKEGNETREQTSRVRVQTDAGVQAWGLLQFPFPSATQTVEILYVRVHKPDGSVVATPEDNVQDLDAEITRSAPFYSDLREKHVAVKGLSKGDVLEFECRWRPIKPLAQGQFWFAYNFKHDGIVLDERLEIKVPSDRAVKLKSIATTEEKTEGTGKIYSWTFKNLSSDKELESEKRKSKRPPADSLLLTCF